MTATVIHGKDWDDVLLCDCASCGRPLLGESMRKWYAALPTYRQDNLPPDEEGRAIAGVVAARAGGRPYCGLCCRGPSYLAGGSSGPLDEGDGSFANVTRLYEDCRGELG